MKSVGSPDKITIPKLYSITTPASEPSQLKRSMKSFQIIFELKFPEVSHIEAELSCNNSVETKNDKDWTHLTEKYGR